MSIDVMEQQEEVAELQMDNMNEKDSDTDPKQKILDELKKMDPSAFTVPEILYAKDPLIIDTKEYHRNKEGKYVEKNPFKIKDSNPLDVTVEPENLNRALRIFSTIIRVLRLRGHRIVASDFWYTCVDVDGESVRVKLLEKRKRVANTEANYPKSITIPTGKLRFEITRIKERHDSTVCVEDSASSKLEDKIINIIAKIEYEAIYIKEFRKEQKRLELEREEAHRRWEIEKQKEKELKARQEEELEKLKEVFISAELYARACILRSYAERYEAFLKVKEFPDQSELEKLQWLSKKVEWIDPFVECEDEWLTDEHKKEFFCSENTIFSYPNPYQSYSSWPEFNFWNNPFKRRY